MARNQEKALSMLSRWYKYQKELHNPGGPEKRPYLATECHSLQEAEKWRHQIIKEIARKVSQIQNAGLGEFRIRDLNDEINKLIREKGHWQDRIVELGGPNYHKIGPKMLDHEGQELPGNRGYKYFGAARDLPGVRELFEEEPPKLPRKTRGDLMKDIDAYYYGYLDDEDGVLMKLEEEAEKKARHLAIEEWKLKKETGELDKELEEEEKKEREEEEKRRRELQEKGKEEDTEKGATEQHTIAPLEVPSQKDVEIELLRKKKMELLLKYASEDLQNMSMNAKTLMGRNLNI